MKSIYQFKVEISGSQPSIWRRIQVESDISFEVLHDTIRFAFWDDTDQEYEFLVNKVRIYDFGAEFDMGENPDQRDSIDTFLDEYVNIIKTQFYYSCREENKLEHSITLEQIHTYDEKQQYPLCIDGERACPPADFNIEAYQNILPILSDKNHPEYKSTQQSVGKKWDPKYFDIKKVNKRLLQYAQEWEEIYNDVDDTMDDEIDVFGLEDDEDYEFSEAEEQEALENEYDYVKQWKHPDDLLEDITQKAIITSTISEALEEADSEEYKTIKRLIELGDDETKCLSMIVSCFAIEVFYDLKYGTGILDKRYQYNLERLPEKPLEIPKLEHAIMVLEETIKGIPFNAIEYLHDDKSPEATSALILAMNKFTDHQNDLTEELSNPLWYALAAEGHLCEDLIDCVIGLCQNDELSSDLLFEQIEYLIGKLAERYPDLAASKVLEALEKEAEAGKSYNLFFLFDVFYFCDLNKYKPKLLELLKHVNMFWHDTLATTLSFLQVKEALPILKGQYADMKAGIYDYMFMIEIEEAIDELEAGKPLYPDINRPLSLRRGTTWKEEFEEMESEFYEESFDPFDSFDLDEFHEEFMNYNLSSLNSPQPPVVVEKLPGRNDPCPCGSGKKYKKCCME
ncbi:MAG: SEC-C metal-binding domain-containing protein [Cyclobacteriaceae bacterium]